MGFFSELDIEVQSCSNDAENCLDGLRFELQSLQNRLDDLEEYRPCDPTDLFYDRYFYEDHITELYESEDTVQGLLRQMELVKNKLCAEKLRERARIAFVNAVLDTGATPQGQLVLPHRLYPVQELNMAA